MQANFVDLFVHCEQMRWQQQIARGHADLFANWQTQQAALNGFAKYSSVRTIADIEPREVQVARGALSQLLTLPHKYMEGPAARAVQLYANGTDLGSRMAFDTQRPVLHGWAKQEDLPFSPAPLRPCKERMSGPYVLPEGSSTEKEALNIAKFDRSSVWIEARSIIDKCRPDLLPSLPSADEAGTAKKRSFKCTEAAEQYAAAVVQYPEKVSRLPLLDEYMQEVCPDGEGGGKGSSKAEEEEPHL